MAAKKKTAKKKTTKAAVPLSPELGKKVSEFLKIKAKISEFNKKAEDLKSVAKTQEEELVKLLELSKTTRADVKTGSVTLKKEPMFTAKDWGKVEKYAIDTGDLSIYQRRLSSSTLKEYLEDGIKIPGIVKGTKKSLNIGRKRGA